MRQSSGIRKLKGTVEKNPRGFGFIVFETRGTEDLFLPPRQAQGLFHGDRVEVTLNGRNDVLECKVIEHRFRELVGRYTPHPADPSKGGWVIYERKRAREEVFVPGEPWAPRSPTIPRPGPQPMAGRASTSPQADARRLPRAGDWVRATLHFHLTGPFPVTAEIVDIYGATLPASVDIQMIAAEYNLTEAHSTHAELEAGALDPDILSHVRRGEREDLRQLPFITIDGETARDFDDAIHVEQNGSGFILWVAIADVSHYVSEGGAIDREARARGTSVYFPERAFHMLPRALSENLCSLRPNEPRLALVARIEIDRSGKRSSSTLLEAVIESRRRATYNEIQEEWENKKPEWPLLRHFELFQLLRKARTSRGSIDFDLPEAEILVQPDGEVTSILQRPRMDAHRLIEEFMIAANEAVTAWIMEREWPFIFRIHDEPSETSLQGFQSLAATVGVRFTMEQAGTQRVMADIIRRLEGHPAQDLLNMAFLRSMKQAIYSAVHSGHYGLASRAYTHFTSPIRRYPDLVVHRLLRNALRVEKKKTPPLKRDALDKLQDKLDETAEHCSYRERLAADAEREAVRLKQVRAMHARLGDDFTGKIIGFSKSGMFVQVDNPFSEGMVRAESMVDDVYEFDEERMLFQGRRRKRSFKIGQTLRVRALKADLETRQVDFGLI